MSIGNNQVEETPEGNFKGEDVLSDIREQSMLLMLENKIPEKQAAEITETLVKKMRKDWGGMLIYFKKQSIWKIATMRFTINSTAEISTNYAASTVLLSSAYTK